VFLFLQEGTQSQSLRDYMRARDFSLIDMHMGDSVSAKRGGRTIEAFDDKFFD
jgi:hypothetical protein